jgi:TetR/AcrR family transcriptional regulator, transcriptional repressor of bet genes
VFASRASGPRFIRFRRRSAKLRAGICRRQRFTAQAVVGQSSVRERSSLKTSIEKIRRQDLVRAAYRTFLEHGLGGMTVARIGERAGMSHGIVNYYFKSKDELLDAVVRHANCLIMQDVAARLRRSRTPRERLSAIVEGNFRAELFDRETANAWTSFYAAVPNRGEFERLQSAVYRRLRSNLLHDLTQLVDRPKAQEIALGISVWIDGLWLRRAMDREGLTAEQAIQAVNGYIDQCLAAAPASKTQVGRGASSRNRPSDR